MVSQNLGVVLPTFDWRTSVLINILMTRICNWLCSGGTSLLFLISAFFFWLCFKGLNIAHCFWFLPMQFNPLGIALVQYMYTLYMHVSFCLCEFFLLGDVQIRCLPWDSFLWQFSVMLFAAVFLVGVLLVVHVVAVIMKCLAIYFWPALKLYSSCGKGYPCNFKTLFYANFYYGTATSDIFNTHTE